MLYKFQEMCESRKSYFGIRRAFPECLEIIPVKKPIMPPHKLNPVIWKTTFEVGENMFSNFI